MFNPNTTPNYSHRSDKFHRLFRGTVDKFKELADLGKEDLVLLVTGSGTLANEIVISSLKANVMVETDGGFSDRLRSLSRTHTILGDNPTIHCGVQYETGDSKWYYTECKEPTCTANNCCNCDFVDCVSAFPFWPLPNVPVITTVSSKQLGGTTGLSIIIIRHGEYQYNGVLQSNKWRDPQSSYLNIHNYVNKYHKDETPNTPAISAIESLRRSLETFDLRRFRMEINVKRGMLEAACRSLDISCYGEGPVFTFGSELPEECASKLYRNSGRPQAFLWDCTIQDVAQFIRDMDANRLKKKVESVA